MNEKNNRLHLQSCLLLEVETIKHKVNIEKIGAFFTWQILLFSRRLWNNSSSAKVFLKMNRICPLPSSERKIKQKCT